MTGFFNMKVIFSHIEAGIEANGFRRVAAVARSVYPNTEVHYLTSFNTYLVSHKFFIAFDVLCSNLLKLLYAEDSP